VKVLIAGANGLAGSALVREFSRLGDLVTKFSRENADFTSFSDTADFISESKPDLFINAAARVGGISANNRYPVDFLIENIQIQNNLAKAAHLSGVKKYIFLGSSCIYPRDSPQPIKEEYLMTGKLESTNSAYSVAKIAGIELVNAYRKQFGHPWISLMPTNLYGPNDNFNTQDSHVLPAMIRRFVEAVENDRPDVTFWGTGSAFREFLHVDDFAKAVRVAANNYNSEAPLNIGSSVEITIKDLAGKVAEITGYKGEIVWDQQKLDGTPRKLLDSSRIRGLGWRPEISLDQGIREVVQWYRSAISHNGEVRI
jgi:GDP-L-fucose synthase